MRLLDQQCRVHGRGSKMTNREQNREQNRDFEQNRERWQHGLCRPDKSCDECGSRTQRGRADCVRPAGKLRRCIRHSTVSPLPILLEQL